MPRIQPRLNLLFKMPMKAIEKTTGLTQFELADDLPLDSNDVFVPPDFVCTPTKRTKVTRRRESGGEPHTPPNQRMALVHEADLVLNIVRSDGSRGEIFLTKIGSGLYVINPTDCLSAGIAITSTTKWIDLLGPVSGKTPFVCDSFPFYQRSLNDAFPQSEFFNLPNDAHVIVNSQHSHLLFFILSH